MKRLLTLALMALAVMVACPAYAAIEGSPHDYKGARTVDVLSVFGQCGTCHVPHAAATGKRLWRVTPTGTGTGTDWANSSVGSLCASCHNGGGIITLHNKNNDLPHPVGGTVYDTNSHGRVMSKLNNDMPAGGVKGAASGQPYTDKANMECTSCHNVHFEGNFANNANRPFLRRPTGTGTYATMSEFCATCHNDRYNNNGVTTTTDPATGYGNHPVNIIYGNDTRNGPATFKATSNLTNNGMAVPVAANSWSLGGKFEGNLAGAPTVDVDKIGCQTCHAIHNPASGTDQGTHLLAVNNVAATAALCEACHGDPTGNTARANSGARMMVGVTPGDHPIDIAVAAPGPVIDRWYSDGSATRLERSATSGGNSGGVWPRGTGGDIIICTSCHSAHRAATKSIAPGVSDNGIGKLTRRGTLNTYCTACHSDPSPAGHHTHSGNSSSSLDCSNCHGIGGTFAHNGFNYNSNFANGAAGNAESQLCNYCHLYATHTAGQDAANGNDISTGIGTANLPADHLGVVTGGQASTKKSHWLGTFAVSGGGVSINVKRNSWANFSSFSKYGGSETHGKNADTTGDKLICESCHSVLHNAGAGPGATKSSGYSVNLLLQNFADDGSGTKDGTGNAAIGSGFCIACHNRSNIGNTTANAGVNSAALEGTTNGDNTNVPAGTHPMTNWSITRAEDAGRTPSTKLVTGAGTYAAATNAPNSGSYPNTDKMDCDSCHRVHYAPTASTYDQTKAGGGGNARPVILERQDAVNEWSTLCQECHAM